MEEFQESAWQALGNLMVVDRRTVSSTQSTRPALRPVQGDPTTAEESRALREWADGLPADIPIRATRDQIFRHLEFLASALPSKAVGDEAGRKRFAVYVSMLQGFSDEALSHMARRACETLDWFPTPHQCIDLAKEFRPPTSASTFAIAACNRFDQSSFEGWIATIGLDEPNLAVPAHWIEIALTRNLLRRMDDGSVVSRARHNAERALFGMVLTLLLLRTRSERYSNGDGPSDV